MAASSIWLSMDISLGDGPVDQKIVLGEGILNGELAFTVNGATYPNVAPIVVSKGALKRLEVRNDTEMDHPFHVHGVFFQNLATNEQPTPSEAIVAKDTIIAPKMTTLKLVARFDEPGAWMYHCHILERGGRYDGRNPRAVGRLTATAEPLHAALAAFAARNVSCLAACRSTAS